MPRTNLKRIAQSLCDMHRQALDVIAAAIERDADDDFTPNAFQDGILKALASGPMKTDALGRAVGNRRRLFQAGGLKELRKAGLVTHDDDVGFALAGSEPGPLPAEDVGKVYFAQVEGGGPVRIGWTDQPERKLASLQRACPQKVTMIGMVEGSRELARKIQRRFRQHRLHGEWFKPDTEVLKFVGARKIRAKRPAG